MNEVIEKVGLVRDLNPGPLAPKARIIPLDQRADINIHGLRNIALELLRKVIITLGFTFCY